MIGKLFFDQMGDDITQHDSYQENDPQGQNRGIFQRFLGIVAQETDEQLLPKIDLLTYQTQAEGIPDALVPIRERSLGLMSPLYDRMEDRRWLLPYLNICHRHKGNMKNYEFLLGRLGFDVTIAETYNNGTWDDGRWDAGRWDSYEDINGTFHLNLFKRENFPTTPTLLAQIERIIKWNKPIHALGYTYQIIGEPDILGISPISLDFGVLVPGENSVISLILENTANRIITVSSIILPYPTYTVDWSGGAIPVGSTQTVHVTYAPAVGGAQNGDIIINSDATNNAITVPVMGAGFLEILAHFDGVANRMKTSVPAVLLSFTGAYTISCYVRTPPAFLFNYYFIGSHADVDNCIFFQNEVNAFAFGRRGGGVQQKIKSSSPSILPNTLYKVDFVSEGAGHTSLKMYVNNVPHPISYEDVGVINSGAASTDFCVSSLGLVGLPYWGDIGYIRVYNKVLSPAERTEQFNSMVPLAIPELLHAWEFQDLQNSATRIDSASGATLTLSGFTPTQQAEAQRYLDGSVVPL